MMSSDLLTKLDEELLSRLESRQWRERGETLDLISRYIAVPSLPPGNYNPLVKALLQVLETDKHNALVVRAANVVEQLVCGLGSAYSSYAERTLNACLNKAKGTNQHIVQALRSTSRAVLQTMSFEAALRPILSAISSPSTGTQIEATSLLAHCLVLHNPSTEHGAELNATQRIRAVKPLLSTLSKLSQHRTPECREASFQAFAATRLFLDMPESNFASFTDGLLDDQRRMKVDMAYDLLKETSKELQLNRQKTARVAPINDSESRQSKKGGKSQKIVKNRLPVEANSDSTSAGTQSGTRRPLREKNSEPTEIGKHPRAAGAGTLATGKSVDKRGRQPINLSSEVASWGDLCDRLSDILHGIDLDQFKSSNWKCRLQTMQNLKVTVTSQPPSGQQIKWMIHFIIQSDRLKDINFQVRNMALETILCLISSTRKNNSVGLDDHLVELLCQHVTPSLVDVKSASLAKQILTRLATGLPVTGHMLNICQESVKPQILANVIEWLADNTIELGLNFDLHEAVAVIKSAFISTNPAVRNAAIRFAGRVHVTTGSDGRLRRMLSDEKPALLSRLDEELSRAEDEVRRGSVVQQSSTKATDSCRPSSTSSNSSSNGGSAQCKRADTTILKSNAPLVDHLLERASESDEDQSRMDWNETTPIKGVIQPTDSKPVIGSVTQAANSQLFFIQSGQTAELMFRKQTRLPNLNKNLCIDLTALKQLFQEANANPSLMQSLFTADCESRLEALDKLLACLDSTDSNQTDPPALTVTYAFFDLLLAWTIGACFTFWLDYQTESKEQLPNLPTRTETRALISGGLQYLTVVISRFAQAQFLLSEQEVELILHALMSDQAPSLRSGLMGQTMDVSVRAAATDLIRLLRQVYPATGLLNRIADLLHRCVSAAARQTCLQELTSLLPRFGDARGFDLAFTLKLVAQQIADPEPGVRQAALECIRLAHRLLGSEIWNMIGPLHPGDQKTLQTHLVSDLPDNSALDSMAAGYTTPLIRNPRMGTLGTGPHGDGDPPLASLARAPNCLDGTALSTTMKSTSRRAASPPPVHSSPAALNVLVPLVNLRNCSTASEALRHAASEKLNAALTCLVNQLDVSPFRTDELDAPSDPDSSSVVAMGTELEESGADESDVLNNVLLGALVDLETLVLDPRTRELLVPFFNAIVNRMASLAQCLANTECNAGHTVFTNCLAGILIVLFEQPFLAREVSANSFERLLANLLLLAEHERLENGSRLRSNARRLIVLRLVCFLHSSVDRTLGFSVLLRLLHTCCLGLDPKLKPKKSTAARRRSARLSSTFQEPGKSDGARETVVDTLIGPTIWRSVLAHLAYRGQSLNVHANHLDWSHLLPLFDQLLSLFSDPTSYGSDTKTGPRRHRKGTELPTEIEACVRRLTVDAYALLGSKLLADAEKCTKQQSPLVAYLRHLAQLMPNAPYSHCLPQTQEA